MWSKLRNWSTVMYNVDIARFSQPQRFFILSSKPEEPKGTVKSNVIMPKVVFKYNPIKYYLSKLRMWKLKWTWDRDFKEENFVEESKNAAVALTDTIRSQDMKNIDRFSTSNVYYQIINEAVNFPHKSFAELLRFRQQDIRQAVPINVHLHDILGLKYAIIDVVFVGLRNVADFQTSADLEKIKHALVDMEPELKSQLDDPKSQLPYVFIEIFMRFRRNYSNVEKMSATELQNHTNRWLVSVYKICRFNIFTVPPSL